MNLCQDIFTSQYIRQLYLGVLLDVYYLLLRLNHDELVFEIVDFVDSTPEISQLRFSVSEDTVHDFCGYADVDCDEGYDVQDRDY